MATAQEIINQAYDKLGVTADSAKSTKGLVSLNNMLGMWGIDGLLLPYRTLESFPLVVGQSLYTIGSSGNFDTVRPLEIISAYIRDSSNVDHTVDVSMTRNEYSARTQKGYDARPERLYYDPQYSVGKIQFDTEPTAVETLYIITEKSFTELAALSTTVSLPDFYKEPLVYNLALRLAPDEDVKLLPEVAAFAVNGLALLNNYISKDKLTQPAKMDNALLRNRGHTYNITTG